MSMPPAVRPTNVRIEHADGRVTPVELAYLGVDKQSGCHVWECSTHLSASDVLAAGTLPARTSIRFTKS